MAANDSGRVHVVTGGFPPGSMGGHDHDYARLRLLQLLAERDVPASVANDFADVEKWLPVSQMLITYVAGPYPDAAQTAAIRTWVEAGGTGSACTAPVADAPSVLKAQPCGARSRASTMLCLAAFS
jgi:hypothetical protein